jgi:hypothetical protein
MISSHYYVSVGPYMRFSNGPSFSNALQQFAVDCTSFHCVATDLIHTLTAPTFQLNKGVHLLERYFTAY